MAKPKRPGAPAGRATRMEDLDVEGRQVVTENMAAMGLARSRIHGAQEAAERGMSKPGADPQYAGKQQHRFNTLKAVEPYVKDKPITIQGAVAGRVERIKQGAERAREEGAPVIRGAGWYYKHHGDIAAAAKEHGFHPEVAITATTALSPNNDPETEKRAGRAIMDIVSNQRKHHVVMTPELHRAASTVVDRMQGPPIPKHMIGKRISLHRLDSTHIGAIGSVARQVRDAGHPIQSSADFHAVGATRLSDEVGQAVRVLRGEVDHHTAIDPHSSPKVWSYREATLAAKPNSLEHLEYMSRLHDFTHPSDQLTMDLTGLQHSTQGMLSPEHDTAEDTWMQSISTRQTPENTRNLRTGIRGRGQSVAKTVGTDPHLAGADAMRKQSASGKTVASDPNITATGLTHAFNNKATRSAAGRLTIPVPGEPDAPHRPMPAVAIQEGTWTEQRIQADKDAEYRAEREEAAPKDHLVGKQFKGQGALFTNPKTPGDPMKVRPEARPPKEYRLF